MLLTNGLFSSIGKDAYIENLSFNNITHTIDLAAVAQDTTFGLFAGALESGASFKNVKLSGSLLFGDSCAELAKSDNFTVNTVFGSGEATGITVGEIKAEKTNAENSEFTVQTEADGSITLTPES